MTTRFLAITHRMEEVRASIAQKEREVKTLTKELNRLRKDRDREKKLLDLMNRQISDLIDTLNERYNEIDEEKERAGIKPTLEELMARLSRPRS